MFFFALVTWHAWGVLRQSYVSDSHSMSEIQMPLIVPQTLWVLGLAFFVLVATLLLVRGLHAFVTGNLGMLFGLIGSKSAVAEAQEEVVHVERAIETREKAMTAAVSLIVLLVILGSSIAVAAGMGLVGVILNQFYSSMPLTRILGELTWSTTSNFILTAIPFYIMFGEILLRSGIAERCTVP